MNQNIVLNFRETHNTQYLEEVYVENNNIFHRTCKYKDFRNIDEILHIVQYLVIQQGFIMEHLYNGSMEMSHPHLSIKYIIWPKTCKILKMNDIIVGKLN